MVIGMRFSVRRITLTPANHKKVMREVNFRSMTRHSVERFPKHFTEEAMSEYAARPRGAAYVKAKRKALGHNKPNIGIGNKKRGRKSGTLFKETAARIKIVAFPHRATWKTRGSTESRLANWQLRELQTVSPAEMAKERKKMARDYRDLATSDKYRRKRAKRTR